MHAWLWMVPIFSVAFGRWGSDLGLAFHHLRRVTRDLFRGIVLGLQRSLVGLRHQIHGSGPSAMSA